MKKDKVRDFIKLLTGRESHYNRAKAKRIYLSCDLSMMKLCKIYNDQATLQEKVTYFMFKEIFGREFNIGFRSPSSDICSYCTRLKEKMKNVPSQSKEKAEIMTQLTVHKRRAKVFYDHLKEEVQDAVSWCFDMQQIQPLPKTPIQEAFYARQIGFYVICITDLKDNKPFFYIWTEEQAGKGSTEISSAMFYHLRQFDFENKKILRLFSDGCIAQNKNNIVLRTLMYFLERSSPIQEIRMTFPVRGHSYLPADRVFGRVEKILRKHPTVLTKEEYINFYKEVGIVKILGKDWELLDTKKLNSSYKDLPSISEMKRINIRRTEKGFVEVKGMKHFRIEMEDEVYQPLRKRGRRFVELQKLPLSHFITTEKKKDVARLLTLMFGEAWDQEERLSWYKDVLQTNFSISETLEEFCDCLEPETCDFHV